MAIWNVASFPHGEVSTDGLQVSVDATLNNGQGHVLRMPYRQLDWLIQALLYLANVAYERQVANGRLAAPDPAGPAITVESYRVLPNPDEQRALVQLTGRPSPGAAVGMGSFIIAVEHMPRLAEQLMAVADELRHRARAR